MKETDLFAFLYLFSISIANIVFIYRLCSCSEFFCNVPMTTNDTTNVEE